MFQVKIPLRFQDIKHARVRYLLGVSSSSSSSVNVLPCSNTFQRKRLVSLGNWTEYILRVMKTRPVTYQQCLTGYDAKLFAQDETPMTFSWSSNLIPKWPPHLCLFELFYLEVSRMLHHVVTVWESEEASSSSYLWLDCSLMGTETATHEHEREDPWWLCHVPHHSQYIQMD